MKTVEIKTLVEEKLFRPFTVRLSNGATYKFAEPRDLGATKNFKTLFFFRAGGGFVMIDAENIVEAQFA